MENTNRKLKFVIASLLIASMFTTAYAVIRYTATLPYHVKVIGYQVKLWRLDSGTEVTSIEWGSMPTGSSKDSDTALGLSTAVHQLAIKNTGDYAAYIGWRVDNATPLPSGLTLTGWHSNMETEPYQNTWNEKTFTFSLSAGGVSQWRIRWVLNVSANASMGDHTFNIVLLAADSSSG